MNRQRVLNIIREPLRMEHEKDLPLIKELIEEFPYFSAPYILLTKLLSEQKSIYLDKYLKLSASYIGNREVLYNLVHSPMAKDKPEPEIATETQPVNQEILVGENIEEPTAEISPELIHIVAAEKVAEPLPPVEEEKDIQQEAEKETVKLAETINATTETVNEQGIIKIEVDEEPVIKDEQKGEFAAEKQVADGTNETENTHLTDIEKNIVDEAAIVSSYEHIDVEEKPEEPEERVEEEQENASALEKTVIQEQAEKTGVPIQKAVVDEAQNKPQEVAGEKSDAENIFPKEEIEPGAEPEILVAKRNQSKDLNLGLPPLAAYDYFAFQEKRKPRPIIAKTDNQITAPENIAETKNNIEIPAKLQPEHTAQAPLKFADWLKSLNTNHTAPAKDKPVETQVIEPVNVVVKSEAAVEKEQPKPERKPKRDEVENIISKFIQSEPRIKPKPAKFFTPQDVAERSAEEDRTLVTETLANIYLKQGLNDKAVEIFKQLMLKYPQKSAYFAVKINEINTNP